MLIDLICAYSASCSGTLLASGTISRSVAREWPSEPQHWPSQSNRLSPFRQVSSLLYRFYLLKKYQTNGNFIRFFAFHYCSGGFLAIHLISLWCSALRIGTNCAESLVCLLVPNRQLGHCYVFIYLYLCLVVSLGIFVLSDSLCFLNPLSFVHLTYTLYSNHISILIQQLPHSKGLPRSPLDSKNEAALPHRCVPQLSVSMACHVSSSVKAHSSRMQADYRLHCNLGRSFRLAFRVIPCHFFGILKDSAHQSHLQTLQPFSHSRFCLLKFGNVEEINDSHSITIYNLRLASNI